jgi:hypothetical protein
MKKREVIVLSLLILLLFSISVSAETMSWRTLYKGAIQKRISYIEVNGIYTALGAITGGQSLNLDDTGLPSPQESISSTIIDLSNTDPNYPNTCMPYVNDFLINTLMNGLKESIINYQKYKFNEQIRKMKARLNELSRLFDQAEAAENREAMKKYACEMENIKIQAINLKGNLEDIETYDELWTSYFCNERSNFFLIEGCVNALQQTHPGLPTANAYSICESCLNKYRKRNCDAVEFENTDLNEIFDLIPRPSTPTQDPPGQKLIDAQVLLNLTRDGAKAMQDFIDKPTTTKTVPKSSCPSGQYDNSRCDRQCLKKFCIKQSSIPECYECQVPEDVDKRTGKTIRTKDVFIPTTDGPVSAPKKPCLDLPPLDCSSEFPGMELLPATCQLSCQAHGDFNSISNPKICHNYKIEIKFKEQGDQICCARKITATPVPGCTAENWGGWTKAGKPILKETTIAPTPIHVIPGTNKEDIIKRD